MSTVTEAAQTVNFDTAWRDALHGRIQRATALVLDGAVFMEEDGHICQVRSCSGQRWYVVNGHCTCKDAPTAPEGYCKHRLAKALYRRASELMHTSLTIDLDPEVVATTTPQGIPAQYITHLHGKPFVRYAGLLALAHERGLVSLKAHLISVTPELARAEAEATFTDGTTYGECADSTPQNVPPHIRLHFPRMALTRAKARALRDALNIDAARR